MDKNLSELTEEELADYFYEHRDDTTGWKRIEMPRKAQRGRSTSVFSVRFTHEELQALQAAADQRGQYISAFIRNAALEEAKETRSMAPVVSGSVIEQTLKSAVQNGLRSVA